MDVLAYGSDRSSASPYVGFLDSGLFNLVHEFIRDYIFGFLLFKLEGSFLGPSNAADVISQIGEFWVCHYFFLRCHPSSRFPYPHCDVHLFSLKSRFGALFQQLQLSSSSAPLSWEFGFLLLGICSFLVRIVLTQSLTQSAPQFLLSIILSGHWRNTFTALSSFSNANLMPLMSYVLMTIPAFLDKLADLYDLVTQGNNTSSRLVLVSFFLSTSFWYTFRTGGNTTSNLGRFCPYRWESNQIELLLNGPINEINTVLVTFCQSSQGSDYWRTVVVGHRWPGAQLATPKNWIFSHLFFRYFPYIRLRICRVLTAVHISKPDMFPWSAHAYMQIPDGPPYIHHYSFPYITLAHEATHPALVDPVPLFHSPLSINSDCNHIFLDSVHISLRVSKKFPCKGPSFCQMKIDKWLPDSIHSFKRHCFLFPPVDPLLIRPQDWKIDSSI